MVSFEAERKAAVQEAARKAAGFAALAPQKMNLNEAPAHCAAQGGSARGDPFDPGKLEVIS